jgi:hypothetical protein
MCGQHVISLRMIQIDNNFSQEFSGVLKLKSSISEMLKIQFPMNFLKFFEIR